MKRFLPIIILLILLVLLLLGFWQRERIQGWFRNPDATETETKDDTEERRTIVENLNTPWEIAFLPLENQEENSDTYLVTERSGGLKIIRNREVERTINIENVHQAGEGGLLGLAIHPNFNENNFIYLYKTTRNNGDIINEVERYTFRDNNISNRRLIIGEIPGAFNHNGGRIAFGPDNLLYVTTGDAQDTSLPQNRNSLAGKILRVNDDGSTPEDNPFDNLIYSYGHRNPQGLAWDNNDNLWSTEHGPTGQDEINLIEAGNNYGWPIIRGDQERAGMETPRLHSGSDTWAPAGMTIVDNKIYFGGLRGAAIFEVNIENDSLRFDRENFKDEYGRIRLLKTGPDGHIYFGTSNRDGRGQPSSGDDRIIRLNLEALREN
jgi:glucose/arabinose dehydrogenase